MLILMSVITQPAWAQSVWMMTTANLRPNGEIYLESFLGGMLIFDSIAQCNLAVSKEPYGKLDIKNGRFHHEWVIGGVTQVTACVEIPLKFLPR